MAVNTVFKKVSNSLLNSSRGLCLYRTVNKKEEFIRWRVTTTTERSSFVPLVTLFVTSLSDQQSA